MKIIYASPSAKSGYANERGAALITVLLISVPLLMVDGALIMITAMSAANTADSAAETKAYYAAEAGGQQVLNVLRGNAAPNPMFASPPSSLQNLITFRGAVDPSTSNLSGDTNDPRLSRWLSYDSTYNDRVSLTSNYSPINGMAFSALLSDPDNSSVVTFSTSGGFPNNGMATSITIGSLNLSYEAQASTTINQSGN